MKQASLKTWLGFLAMGLGFGMVYLDQTALNVALTTIQTELGATETELFWIVNAYFLPLAIFSLGAGRMGDMLGLRKVFLGGVVVFALASVGCASATSAWFLIAFRVLQGVGGAVIPVMIAASVYHLFPSGKRGKPMGVVGFIASMSVLVGPIIGGIFTSYSSWRWIFWVNPILGAICFVLIYFLIRHLDEERELNTTFDIKGLVIFMMFLAPVIIALMQGENWGWTSSAILSLFALSCLCLPFFVWYEKRQKHPLFDLKLLKRSNFSIGLVVFFCGQFAFIASVFITLYLMRSLGKTPVQAAIGLLPMACIAGLMNPVAGYLTEKMKPQRQIQLGLTGATIGYLIISLTAHTMAYHWLLVGLIFIGFSVSTFFMATYALIINSTPRNQQGMSSGMGATLRQVGASFAMSIMSIIVIAVERKSSNLMSSEEKFMHGFAVSMALVALTMTIALVSSLWIEQPAEDVETTRANEEKLPTKP